MRAAQHPKCGRQAVLPDFTRIAWVSDAAREKWQPRLNAIGKAWAWAEWMSVAEGMRTCALIRIEPGNLPGFSAIVAHYGLSVLPLAMEGQSGQSYSSTPAPYEAGQPFVYAAAVGPIKQVSLFAEAWNAGDHLKIGSLLGFPGCCSEFFVRHWIDDNRVDSTWPMAEATSAAATRPAEGRIDIAPERCEANILCRWIGMRLVPHLPCRFDCPETLKLGARFRQLLTSNGFEREAEWLDEILSWPLEWSALHGIAEIRLPVLKIATRTDATAEPLTVRLLGTVQPDDAVSGLRFPYRNKQRIPLSASQAFKLGLEDRDDAAGPELDDSLYRDNGFTSHRAMEVAHTALLDAAGDLFEGRSGAVLDLGCGNGLLLEKICEAAELTPCGVDVSGAAIARAKDRFPAFAGDFAVTDLFETDNWPAHDRFEIVLLMIGRLTEVDAERAGRLVEHLKSAANAAILYRYAGYSDEPMADLMARFGLLTDRARFATVPRVADVAIVDFIDPPG